MRTSEHSPSVAWSQPALRAAGLLLAALSLAASARRASAEGDQADPRFQGADKPDLIRIANGSCNQDGAATLKFDLAWDWSWRATLEEPAERTGGKEPFKTESWDAAWVFVKFRAPGGQWTHATLSAKVSDHSAPAGARLDLGLDDSGKKAVGVFVCRAASGSGPVDWKGLTLRWLHAADGLPVIKHAVVETARAAPSPVKASQKPPEPGEDELPDDTFNKEFEAPPVPVKEALQVRVIALHMVYVPEGAFWVGDGTTNVPAGQFTAGNTAKPFRFESEAEITLGGADPKNLGNSDAILTRDDFSSVLTRPLPAHFPKGFAAFYCMRRELTRGELVTYLNTLNADQQRGLSQELLDGNKIQLRGTGASATYAATEPDKPCLPGSCADGLAYAAWAGLRPLTELEFEKAGRGPLKPVPDEFAWGTAETNARGGRATARASYWGILGLSGGAWEMTVSTGSPAGRLFNGRHGDGAPARPPEWDPLLCAELGRGGDDSAPRTLANREERVPPAWTYRTSCGFRLARSLAAGKTPLALPDESAQASVWFNEPLQLTSLKTVPRDAKTAALQFDLAWPDSWRNATNHDAMWIFFKTRPKGTRDWEHVRLAADRVLNPAGYGQTDGTKLDFVVPDGKDGFTGVLVQRAAEGVGAVAARGVTVLWDVGAGPGLTADPDIQAFAIEMVHVAEGPFYLGSGGAGEHRFYQYTDGRQNTQPYRVTDAGAIPTGPQTGRLWATGVTPDAGDAGEIPAAFPNGYRAFYCMKNMLRRGQFAGFLAMQSEVKSAEHTGRSGIGPTYVALGAAYGAGLTWWQGAAFGAWAGLRPMTELEYEKACRGPVQPAPDDTRATYWGIRELNHGLALDRVVSVGAPAARTFAGTHGTGAPALPPDWPPQTGAGVMRRGNAGAVAQRRKTSEKEKPDRHIVHLPDWDLAGWRGVRTAPTAATPRPRTTLRMELMPVPELKDADVAAFYLEGNCHNDGEQPVKFELRPALPDGCFPDEAETRTFTAAPKTATPFRALTVATLATLRASRRGQALPVRALGPGGEILAEAAACIALPDPLTLPAPTLGALEGGKLVLRMMNTTDRALTFALELTPPGDVRVEEARQSLNLAARAAAEAVFMAPPQQAFRAAGLHRFSYRVSIGQGAPQDGDLVVELLPQSRWWVAQSKILGQAALALSKPEESEQETDEVDKLLEDAGLADSAAQKVEKKRDRDWAPAPEIFKNDKPPVGWKSVTNGASLWLSKLNPLPTKATIVQAATRVTAPSDREAEVKVASESAGYTWVDNTLVASRDWGSGPGTSPFAGRIWFNGEVVYDSRPGVKPVRKTVPIRKGVNTMQAQCLANADDAEKIGNVFVLFCDAKTGMRMADLVLDMERR